MATTKRESLRTLLRDLIQQHGEPSAADVRWAERALAGRPPAFRSPKLRTKPSTS